MGYDWIFDGIERSSFWWSDQENTQNGGLRSRPMIWDILLRDNPWMWTNNRFPSGLTKHQAARIGFPSLKSPNQQRPRHVFTFPSLPPAVAGTATPPPAGRRCVARCGDSTARWPIAADGEGESCWICFEGKNWSPKWRLSWLISWWTMVNQWYG